MNNPIFYFVFGIGVLFLFITYLFTEEDNKKIFYGSILSFITIVACFLALYPPQDSIKGGIDITGGSAYTVSIQSQTGSTGEKKQLSSESVEQVISILRKRLNRFGTKDLLIQQQGKNRLIIEIPELNEKEREAVKTALGKSAYLQLKAVHPNNEKLTSDFYSNNGKITPPVGYSIYRYQFSPDRPSEILLLKKQSIIDGNSIRFAQSDYSRRGIISIELDNEGGKKMTQATLKMKVARDRIAILLDDEVLSAPVLQSTPLGSSFQITGIKSNDEAEILATSLMNPLQNPLILEEERSISPRLGKATVQQGVWAGIFSLVAILFFMIWYYRFSGIIALITLLCSLIILFGVMAWLQFTLTLPGIAGIILILGISVDINVLIYERMREEIANGTSGKIAFKNAFQKAFSGIFDANFTTLIAACILFWKTNETIKGFAVTLILGIFATMFSSLLVNRTLFLWSDKLGLLKKVQFRKKIFGKIYPILKHLQVTSYLSIILVLGSLLLFGIKGKQVMGIDFSGGKLLHWQLGKEKIEEAKVREVLFVSNLKNTYSVQEEKSPISGNFLSIRCSIEDEKRVLETLRENFPLLAKKTKSSEYLFPITIHEVSSFLGKEFFVKSITAIFFTLLAIIIYLGFRFRPSFALGALIALIHDIIITAGFITLVGTPFSLLHIGAFLTIAGYSINDSIIIFDRIREIETTEPSKTSIEIGNKAISYTLSRTMITSLTTFTSTFILWSLGNFDLKEFSFAIMIGIIVGTYSSLFISTPIGLSTKQEGIKQ